VKPASPIAGGTAIRSDGTGVPANARLKQLSATLHGFGKPTWTIASTRAGDVEQSVFPKAGSARGVPSAVIALRKLEEAPLCVRVK
jgi:hypothetical protein